MGLKALRDFGAFKIPSHSPYLREAYVQRNNFKELPPGILHFGLKVRQHCTRTHTHHALTVLCSGQWCV